jgi:hypothetical protein
VLDVTALQQENISLRAPLSALAVQLAESVASNTRMSALVAELNDRVTELVAVAGRKYAVGSERADTTAIPRG